MTKLKEELKIGPDEEPVEYIERAEAVLERRREETGERLSLWSTLPGEGADDVLARMKVVREAEGIRSAERARQREQQGKGKDMTKDVSSAAEESTRSFRLKAQERDVEKAVAAHEAEKKRLYRDGVKFYSDEEHTRRLDEMTTDLRQKIEAVAGEATTDAEKYEKDALALSYSDPLKNLPNSERAQVTASMPLVREDCETMPLGTLVERMRAVAAGTDKPSKLLHARYGLRRYEAENTRLTEARQSTGESSVGTMDTAALRELKTVAEEIAQALKDPAETRKREAALEAARKSHQIVTTARSRLSQADGTAERARREQAEMIQATF